MYYSVSNCVALLSKLLHDHGLVTQLRCTYYQNAETIEFHISGQYWNGIVSDFLKVRVLHLSERNAMQNRSINYMDDAMRKSCSLWLSSPPLEW